MTQEIVENSFKRDARRIALNIVPKTKIHADGREIPCTASDIIENAEIIYMVNKRLNKLIKQ